MAMTVLIGSICTYVKTIDSKLKSNGIKLALNSATTEKKTSSIATRLAKARTADRPTLLRVVDKGVKQHTSQIEQRLQSLESQLGNTANPKAESTHGTRIQNGHLKGQRGANNGATATKKWDSTISSPNRKASGAGSAGGSRAGSKQDRSASNAGKSPRTSGQKSNTKKPKNNKSKARS